MGQGMGVLPPIAGHGGSGLGRGSLAVAGRSRWCQGGLKKREGDGCRLQREKNGRRRRKGGKKKEDFGRGLGLCKKKKRKEEGRKGGEA